MEKEKTKETEIDNQIEGHRGKGKYKETENI